MTFSALDTVIYTLAFLVPGFIINSIFSRFCSEDEQETQLLLLRFLTFSAINYAAWSWLIYLIFRLDVFVSQPLLTAILWLLIVFVSPIVLGCLFGWLEQSKFFPNLLSKYNVDIAPLDNSTAWDNRVQSLPSAEFVLVTLISGKEIRGIMGSESFATRLAKGGDLYLEQVMIVDPSNPTGPWLDVLNSKGIWIRGSQIKYVEFWG